MCACVHLCMTCECHSPHVAGTGECCKLFPRAGEELQCPLACEGERIAPLGCVLSGLVVLHPPCVSGVERTRVPFQFCCGSQPGE